MDGLILRLFSRIFKVLSSFRAISGAKPFCVVVVDFTASLLLIDLTIDGQTLGFLLDFPGVTTDDLLAVVA